MSDCTLALHQIAERLQLSPRSMRRRIVHLQEVHGFPRALPGLPGRWSTAAVLSWIEHGGAPADNDNTTLDVIRARLASRPI